MHVKQNIYTVTADRPAKIVSAEITDFIHAELKLVIKLDYYSFSNNAFDKAEQLVRIKSLSRWKFPFSLILANNLLRYVLFFFFFYIAKLLFLNRCKTLSYVVCYISLFPLVVLTGMEVSESIAPPSSFPDNGLVLRDYKLIELIPVTYDNIYWVHILFLIPI